MKSSKTLLFVCIYSLLLLAGGECLVRLLLAIPQVFERLQSDNDAYWRLAWIKQHRRKGDITYTFDRYDATKGWFSRSKVQNARVFDGKWLHTNSNGWRGAREFAVTKTPGLTRIVILGDSFTFGDGVSDDETYAHYLQEMLPNTEILNLGVHGYGHDQMLILLKEAALRYQPDIVMVGYYFRDMYRNGLTFRDFAKPKFRLVDGRLVLTNTPVPSPQSFIDGEWLRLKVLDLGVMLRHAFRVAVGTYERQIRRLSTQIFREMIATIDAHGARAIFVYLPVARDITAPEAITSEERFFFAWCQQHARLACTTVRPAFTAKVRQGFRFRRGHWAPLGHRTAAESLRDFLLAHRFVPHP